jgi:hypothetical protein
MLTHSIRSGALSTGAILPACDTVMVSSTKPCKAGIKIDADGNVYTMLENGTYSQCGTWLLAGTNSTYTLVRTLDSGSLTTDSGASTLLSSDAAFTISNPSIGTTKTTVITLDMTVTAGGAIVDSRQYTLVAILA